MFLDAADARNRFRCDPQDHTTTNPSVAGSGEPLFASVEPKRKPITARNYRNIYTKHIKKALGHRRAREVTRQEVAELHHANRAIPTQANRILALLSSMMTFAESQGDRPDGSNPCRHVTRLPDQKRERLLSDEELGRLGKALSQ